MAQEHGQINSETCRRREIEIGVHSRLLQHGQESQQELFHQSVPKTPSHPDSVGTKTLREVLLREKAAFQLVKGVATKVPTKMSTASSATHLHALWCSCGCFLETLRLIKNFIEPSRILAKTARDSTQTSFHGSARR